MKFSLIPLFASAALASVVFGPFAASADDKPMTHDEVEAIVKKVIQDNPEIIFNAAVQGQQKAQADRLSKAALNITKMQDKIQHDPNSPVAGNPKGDVTITEFFDYHCHYCKDFMPHLTQLLHEDKNVRVVFKEFPILSPDSADASKAALAVYSINKSKYLDYHVLLMKSTGQFTEDMLAAKAKEVGIDEEVFREAYAKPEWQKEIDSNKQLAGELAISGTPSIIVGTEFSPGAISYEALKEKVKEVREKHKKAPEKEKSDD